MKRFKNLVESVGSPASDQKQKKDDDDEVKGYKPRSKGEEDFANMHNVDKKKHPVAEPYQHTGDRKGPKSDSGEDHDGHEKAGQKVDKTYAQFMKMGGYGGSSKRSADKSDGDTKMPKIKEEVELDEWTVSDVELAMKKKYGKVDKEAIEKLKKVQYKGNVDRNDLVKVGHGKLHVEEVEFVDEAFKKGSLKLNSGETVRVDESDARALNDAFSQLNSSNRKRMETEAMKDKQSFEAMVKFAKSV